MKVDFVSNYQDNVLYGLEVTLFIFRSFLTSIVKLRSSRHFLSFSTTRQRKTTLLKLRIRSKFDIAASYKYPGVLFKNITIATLSIQGSNL